MCGRYFLTTEDPVVQRIVDTINRRYAGKPALSTFHTGEIAPTSVVPVYCLGRQMHPSWFLMKWGYTLPGKKLLINARAETLTEKPLFRDSAQCRRCLIPASGYFEWHKTEQKNDRYAFVNPQSALTWLTGIYRLPDEESALPEFTIVTRAAAAQAALIHDRMPLLLTREERAGWLEPGKDIAPLLASGITNLSIARSDGQVA